MNQKTPFGPLHPPEKIEQKRVYAVHRALRWCETILSSTLWTPVIVGDSVSLQRTINEQTIELFPLEAAYVDLGMKSRFAADHLPIHLNNSNACVRSTHSHPRPLHTDMSSSSCIRDIYRRAYPGCTLCWARFSCGHCQLCSHQHCHG